MPNPKPSQPVDSASGGASSVQCSQLLSNAEDEPHNSRATNPTIPAAGRASAAEGGRAALAALGGRRLLAAASSLAFSSSSCAWRSMLSLLCRCGCCCDCCRRLPGEARRLASSWCTDTLVRLTAQQQHDFVEEPGR